MATPERFKEYQIASSGSAVNDTWDPDHAIEIHEVRFRSSGPVGSGELKCKIDASSGEWFDNEFLVENVTSQQYYREGFDPPVRIANGDQILTTCPNTGAYDLGITIIYSEL